MFQSKLFQPLKIGDITLQHRIVMAPLTRYRADKQHVPLPFVKEYYGQRASTPGTLLIAEGTLISQQAAGEENVAGIWTKEQIAAWKQVTDEVHTRGSYIFLQLRALGRVAVPDVAKIENITIKAPSAIGLDGFAVPEELTAEDIRSLIEDHAKAAKNAMEAGFDGVELHGANGQLVDQFVQDNTNQRSDEFGGSIQNRSRFPLQVLEALIKAVGSEKVGLRLSPWSDYAGMRMADPVPQFTYLIGQVNKLKLAYLHLIEPRISGPVDTEITIHSNDFAFKVWDKTSPLLIAGGLKPDSAKELVDKTHQDSEVAAVFGRHFLANPDLPFRIQKFLELNPYHRDTFYNAESPTGYADYPFSAEWQQEKV